MHSSSKIKDYLLNNLNHHQRDIIQTAINKFGVSRQAIHKHMNRLIDENKVVAHGATKGRYYELLPLVNITKTFDLNTNFSSEGLIKDYIIPNMTSLPININEIFEFSIGALINNVMDHSGASKLYLKLFINHNEAHFIINDNGIGIFELIKSRFDLADINLAAFELVKGELTTDPNNHSGDELITVIHLFDKVNIDSSGKRLNFLNENINWNISYSTQQKGTRIHLSINPSSDRNCSDVFNLLFDSKQKKIYIPIYLLEKPNQRIINSRSLIKSALRNIQKYKVIEFDFNQIKLIGPSFADALIRETIEKNECAKIEWVNTNSTVELLLNRAFNRLVK